MEWNVKHINPGYEEGSNSFSYLLTINCKFADQIYSKYLDKKYGVVSCLQDELLRYSIKRDFLALDKLFIKNLCNPICIPPVDICVTFEVYRQIWCYPPLDVSGSIYVPVIVCNAPTDISSQITYAGIR